MLVQTGKRVTTRITDHVQETLQMASEHRGRYDESICRAVGSRKGRKGDRKRVDNRAVTQGVSAIAGFNR